VSGVLVKGPALKSLDLVRDLSGRMRAFFDIWDRARGTAVIPFLRDIKVTELGPITPHCSLVQRLTPEKTVLRFCGTEMEKTYDRPLVGADIRDIVKEEMKEQFLRSSNFTMDRPCGAHVCELLTFKNGNQAHATTFSLPLAGKDGSCNHMLNCVEYEGVGYRMNTPGVINLTDQRELVFVHFLDIGRGR